MSTVIERDAVAVSDLSEWARQGGLFAILDACDTPSVPDKVNELGDERAVSLYRGGPEEEFASFAPYLVAVDSALFDWITGALWREPWGIFVRSAHELGVLRTHFRKFLMVKSPDGEDWYFRFYDPRVLDSYLLTCTADEVQEFFGPVESFAITSGADGAVTRLRVAGR